MRKANINFCFINRQSKLSDHEPSEIPFIREVFVGRNCNEAEKWDVCLHSVFDNLEDVKAYSVHPSHKAVASEFMKIVAERACVDFEI